MVHDVSLLQGILEHYGSPWLEHADDGAWWDEGRAISLSAALPGGGRAHLVHHNLPGVNDYSERLTVHCRDRVLELTFPSPYLRHLPTRLVEHRSEGVTGLRPPTHHASYEEAFRNELRAFARRLQGRGRWSRPSRPGRADVALLIDAYQRAKSASLRPRPLTSAASRRGSIARLVGTFQTRSGRASREGRPVHGRARASRSARGDRLVRRARHP